MEQYSLILTTLTEKRTIVGKAFSQSADGRKMFVGLPHTIAVHALYTSVPVHQRLTHELLY